LQDDSATEIWSAPDARVAGAPSIAPDGRRMAFSVRRGGHVRLYVANTDGTGAREISSSFEPEGTAAWATDGRSLVVASPEGGTPRLYRVPLDGGTATPLTRDYSVDPVWWPGTDAVVYSGADVGTTFPVQAAPVEGDAVPPLPPITLSRGARRMAFLPGTRSLVVLRGDISHKNLWAIDLDSGHERQLTDFPPGFEVSDFDVSPDGKEVVVEQVQERSEIVLIER
jgi:Tol biopolymer transport system component